MARTWNNNTNTYIEHYVGGQYDVPITIACWANPSQTNANDTLVSFNAGSISEALGTALVLRINSTANVVARSQTESTNAPATTTDTYSANIWQHFAARFASATSRIAYLNGNPSQENQTPRLTPGLEYLIIGRGSGGTQDPIQAYNGSIAELGVWDAALSTEEIQSLAKGFKPTSIQPDKLIAYFPLIREVNDFVSGGSPTVSGTTIAVHPRRYG